MTPVDLSSVVLVSRCHGSAIYEEPSKKRKKWVLKKCSMCKQQCAVVNRKQYDARFNEVPGTERQTWNDAVEHWSNELQTTHMRIAGMRRYTRTDKDGNIVQVPSNTQERLHEEQAERLEAYHAECRSKLEALRKVGLRKGWLKE